MSSRMEIYGDGEYRNSVTTWTVKCSNCKANSATVTQRPFCQWSDYTVQDFRDIPSLRDSEIVGYELYLEKLKRLVMASWENRKN